MSSFENKKRRPSHLRIQEDATESQILILWGEEALERAHRVSHGIEESVHKLLDDTPTPSCSSLPDQPDQLLSNRHTGDEKD